MRGQGFESNVALLAGGKGAEMGFFIITWICTSTTRLWAPHAIHHCAEASADVMFNSPNDYFTGGFF